MTGDEDNDRSTMSQLDTLLKEEKSIINANWLHVHESSVFTICRET